MKKIVFLALALACLLLTPNTQAQTGILDINDTIVEYDELNPPAFPNWGVLSKWVRTKRVNWNTDSYKCYYYKGMPFRLKWPLNYDTTGNTKYPMILMFHGRGNFAVSLYDNEKPLRTGGDGGRRYRDAVDNGEFDGFVLFPQNTSGFFNINHFAALDDLINNYLPDIHVDINRISLTGSSAGAYGVWDAALAFPSNYAALLPMSGVSIATIPHINTLRQTPVWLFQGGKDKSPTPYTANLVKDAGDAIGMDFQYTEYPNGGHGIWSKVYSEPDLLPYMTAANMTNPVVYFGKTEFCPGDVITATMGLTPGFDGYEWRKDGVVLAGANSHELVANQLGTYEARIKRGNDWSYWSKEPVVLKMKGVTITPPIEIVGAASHLFPSPDSVNEVTLTVPGDFITYEWKIDGQPAVLGTDATFTTSSVGDYVVSVTEKFGCQSSDSDVFSILDANAANGPEAPNSVSVFAVSKTSLKVVWNDNPNSTYNETAFEVYRSDNAGGPYQYIGTSNQDAVEYLDDNLPPNTTYYYIIRAINENAASATTTEASGTTKADIIAPNAPANLTLVTTSTNSISIRWNTALDDVGVEKYEVYVGGIKSVVTKDTVATIYNLSPYQTYNVTVKARDFAGNLSPASTPLTTITVFTGLDYKYYEGVWTVLPDFNTLTPVSTGHVDNIDISLKQVTDDYAFLWEGKIHIPVAGNYTFETRSDDGSKVYIGGYDSIQVVNNDGRHSARYRSGTYNFPTAGVYDIAVSFFRNGNSETMQLYWKNTAHGIGSTRQLIPNSAFTDFTPLPGNPPKSPQNLSATAISYDQIDLAWEDSSSTENGFQLLRKTGSTGIYTPIVTTAANVTSYSDINLNASTDYDYKVIALGNYGVSSSEAAESAFSLNFNNNIDDQSGSLVSSLQNGATYIADNSIEGSHALLLDGNNDYVRLGPGNGLLHNSFTGRTVAMWAKIENYTGARVIYDEGGTGQGFAIRTNNGQLEAAIRQSGNQTTIGGVFNDTNWIHIAAVYNAGSFVLYVNGDTLASDPNIGYSTITNHGNGAGLGGTNGNNAFGSNGNRTQGRIDDFHVFSVGLTQEEIKSLILKNSIFDGATTFPLPAVPNVPTNLTATALSSDIIELNWQDNSNNEDEFIIYRSANTNTNFLPIGTITGDTTTGAETYTDSGLFANAIYHYMIEANNAGGADTTNQAVDTTLNNLPELDEVPDVMVRYNTTENIQLFATDADADIITFSGANLPGFATLTDYGDGSGLLSVSPLIADTNTYNNIVIRATDALGGLATDTFTIQVIDNFLPSIAPIANLVMDEGDSISVIVNATDSNGVTSLAWSTTDLPSFATFNPNNDGTAIITFKPGFADGGTYNRIQVSVDDQNGGISHEAFDLIVNEINPNRIVKVNFQHSVAATSPWNNVNSVNSTALDDEDGNPTGFGVDVLGTVWNSWNDGNTTGDNSGIVPDDVLKEYYYFGIFGAPNTVDFDITGLNPSGAYHLSIVASSKWNGVPNNGSTKYEVGGKVDSLDVHLNSQNKVDFNLILPDTNGNITVAMSKAASAPVGYINGFILEEVHNYGVAPDAARNLTASFGGGGVSLSWYDAPFNETGYNVFRSDSENGTYSQINTQVLEANATAYTDNNVSENQNYYYKVQAVNGFGVSGFSNVANAFVPNTAPALTITGDTLLTIDSTSLISIQATDAPSNTITLSTSGLPSFATLVDSANGNGTVSILPGSSDAGNYSFTVTATDNIGAASNKNVTFTVKDEKLYSVYVNFSNTSNAGAPWNNTSKVPTLNDVFSNLNDDSNNATGIDLELTTNFGGVFNQGAQTGDDSGIIPDAALLEYYWFGIFGAPNETQIKISGLDNQKKYNFSFIGSSTFSGAGVTDNGETDFTIGNVTQSVDVQGNTSSSAFFEGLIADNNGEIIVDIGKGNGAAIGYINAMIIDVYNADSTRFDPANLTAVAVSSSAIDLQWTDNSLDEIGFEIQRSTTGLEIDFIAVDTAGSDITTYQDTGLLNTQVYYYRVRALRGSSNTGFTNIASSGTVAFKVYINVNGNALFDAPAPWNNLSIAASSGDIFTGFMNNLGNPSGMSMTWNTAMAGSNEWGTNTGNNSGVYEDIVMESFYFNDAFDAPASITMSGLSQAYTYNFDFFGAIVTGFDIRTKFTIGNTTVINSQTNNISEVASINAVSPDNNNEIDITVQEDAGSNWAIFNSLVIEAVTAVPLNSKIKGKQNNITDGIAVNYGLHNPSINIYPNPISGNIITLGFTDAMPGDFEITISDLTGRMIKQKSFTNSLSNGKVLLDLKNDRLRNGIYIVKVKFADGKSSTNRLVKMESEN